jgi:hypothetical protein
VENWGLLWYFQPYDLVAKLYFYMYTKSYTFTPYRLQDHKVQSWKIKVFSLCSRSTTEFWGSKNHFLEQVWIKGLQILIPRLVRYMSTKSHIHKTYGTLKKTSFCTKGYPKIHIQRPFLTLKKTYGKFLY